jgi:hypothetical protein
MDEPIEMRTCDYGNDNFILKQMTTNVILLNGVDLTQLLQSLTDRILELEIKAIANVAVVNQYE